MAKKPSAMEMLQQRREHLFVGRDEEREAFQRNFTRALPDQYLIFAIYGLAGIGKSFLVDQYRRIAAENGALTALTNEAETAGVREQSIIQAMAWLTKQLADAGAPLEAFNTQHTKYRDSVHQIEADPKAPPEVFGRLGRTVARAATSAVKATLVGHAADGALTVLGVGEDKVVDRSEQRGRYLAQKFKAKPELVSLVKAPVEILTPLFVQGLNELAEDRTVVLCFDTWERTSGHLDAWLRSLYEREGLSAGVWLIIAGRNPPGDEWEPFLPMMTCIGLHEFTEGETRDYLRKQGITDEGRVEQILAFSGGVPVLVSTLASARGGSATDAANGLVDRYLRWVDDPLRRRAALRCAAARRLYKDIVAAVMGPDDADALFGWLIDMPFVQSRPGYWEYNPKVRRLMLHAGRSRSTTIVKVVHAQLRSYHQQFVTEKEGEAGYRDVAWRLHALEALYHGLMQGNREAECEGLETFLLALRGHHSFAGDIVLTWLQAAEEQEIVNEVTKWAAWLSAGWAAIQSKSWSEALSLGVALASRQDLSDLARAEAHRMSALAYYDLLCYEQAINEYTEAIQLNPDDATAYTNRGLAYTDLHQHAQAIADYDRAIQLNPHDATAYNNRGFAYAHRKEYYRAIADYDRAIELNPEYATAYTNRGNAYFDLEEYERAIADYDCAIELNPQYAAAYSNRGNVYAELRDYERAIASYSQAVQLDPQIPLVHKNWGDAYARLRDYGRAIAEYTRAIELDPHLVSAYTNRGAVYAELSDYGRAIADYERAIELNPHDSIAYNNRGIVHARRGEHERAIADYGRAIDVDAEDAQAYYNRGLTYALLRDYEHAMADYRRTVEINADFSPAFYNAACVCALRGEPKEASRWLQRAINLNGEYREMAQTDEDFDGIRDDRTFHRLVQNNPSNTSACP